MEATYSTSESVRRYFAQLALKAQPRAAIEHWQSLPVESFFLAVSVPPSLINRERKECGVDVPPLSALFDAIKWG